MSSWIKKKLYNNDIHDKRCTIYFRGIKNENVGLIICKQSIIFENLAIVIFTVVKFRPGTIKLSSIIEHPWNTF